MERYNVKNGGSETTRKRNEGRKREENKKERKKETERIRERERERERVKAGTFRRNYDEIPTKITTGHCSWKRREKALLLFFSLPFYLEISALEWRRPKIDMSAFHANFNALSHAPYVTQFCDVGDPFRKSRKEK